MSQKNPEIIDSPLSQMYTVDGEKVEVTIYRLKNTKWKLEVIDSHGTRTVWDDDFSNDKDAWAEFLRDVANNGIAQFIALPVNPELH